MRGVGTAAAVSVVGVGSMGTAAAQTTIGVDYGNALVHEGRLETTVEIDELDLSSQRRYGYIGDDGAEASLVDHGFSELSRADADADVDPTPHNPDSYNPANLSGDELSAFPRGVTETVDGEEEDVSALDADYWTGSATVSDSSDVLTISALDGESASFAHEDFLIDSGEARRQLQLIVSVSQLDAGATVDISVLGAGTETPTVSVVEGGDDTQDDVITTETTEGAVLQQQLGELVADGDELIDLDEIEVSVAGGSAEIDIVGLNLDGSSRWTLGQQEQLDEDEEIETVDVVESTGGWIDIVSIDTLGDRLSDLVIEDIRHDVEQLSRDLDADRQLAFEDEAPAGYDSESRLTQGLRHYLPTAYDLSYEDSELILIGGLQESRYLDLGYDIDAPEVETQEDVLDAADNSTYVGGSVDVGPDSELSLSTSVSEGAELLIIADIVLSDDELSDLEGGAMFGAAGSSGGDGFFDSARNRILALGAAVAALLAGLRGN